MPRQRQVFTHIWKGIMAMSQLAPDEFRSTIEELSVAHFRYNRRPLSLFFLYFICHLKMQNCNICPSEALCPEWH